MNVLDLINTLLIAIVVVQIVLFILTFVFDSMGLCITAYLLLLPFLCLIQYRDDIKLEQKMEDVRILEENRIYIYALNEETQEITYPDSCDTRIMTCTIGNTTFKVDKIERLGN